MHCAAGETISCRVKCPIIVIVIEMADRRVMIVVAVAVIGIGIDAVIVTGAA